MSFFASRWRGDVPLDRLFWRDMVLVGSMINVLTAAAALLLLGMKAPLAAVLAVHFGLVPYNLFLFTAVWRTADSAGGAKASMAKTGALAWLIATTVI
jgi:hypothetical protein